MPIARFPSIVIDCSDPGALATFYGEMLDWKVDVSSGWAEVRAERGPPSRADTSVRYAPNSDTET